jgi:hypothetical protein
MSQYRIEKGNYYSTESESWMEWGIFYEGEDKERLAGSPNGLIVCCISEDLAKMVVKAFEIDDSGEGWKKEKL